MKEKYITPEIKTEILSKSDVICASDTNNHYNINGKFEEFFKKVTLEDLL